MFSVASVKVPTTGSAIHKKFITAEPSLCISHISAIKRPERLVVSLCGLCLYFKELIGYISIN